MKLLLLAVLSGAVSAYVTAPKTFVTSRPSTKLSESFGFDFAVDSYSSQDDRLAGEAAYKQWINKVSDDPFLNRQVCEGDKFLKLTVSALPANFVSL